MPSSRPLRERTRSCGLTLEVHERALADLAASTGCRTQLGRPGVGLAYDDFGAGQARLLELAEVPPTYLKFDMSFVRGIDSAPPSRQRLLSSLVSVARELLVNTVAEGVETAEEADVCMHVGFTHAQGFFFGRPRPLSEMRSASECCQGFWEAGSAEAEAHVEVAPLEDAARQQHDVCRLRQLLAEG